MVALLACTSHVGVQSAFTDQWSEPAFGLPSSLLRLVGAWRVKLQPQARSFMYAVPENEAMRDAPQRSRNSSSVVGAAGGLTEHVLSLPCCRGRPCPNCGKATLRVLPALLHIWVV